MKKILILSLLIGSFAIFSMDKRLLDNKLPYDLTKEDLASLYHLPIKDAANELSICTTLLKKICRQNGIKRWPHRQFQAVNQRIMAIGKNPEKYENPEFLVRELDEQRSMLIAGDYMRVGKSAKKIKIKDKKPIKGPQKTIVKGTKIKCPLKLQAPLNAEVLVVNVNQEQEQHMVPDCNLDNMTDDELFCYLKQKYQATPYPRIDFSKLE
ncbi:MAG: RWP-RK domain-containing protein [Myxococcales bacterium]|nr:RWP-RK domain-containing protein [Myxococcales bacterium]USN50120.1 MAG: RWP-RK domain-containing protein [Myxococcales bacterium]